MAVAEHQLITGPSRGGKSEWAEHQVSVLSAATASPVTYLATGPAAAGDASWEARLEKHRLRRPADWNLVEAAKADEVIKVLADPSLRMHLILLDSLGGIVAAGLDADATAWEQQQNAFLAAVDHRCSSLVIVAEEVGWGVVPPTAIGGVFRDRNGTLVRRCGERCKQCWLVSAGRALPLHGLATDVPSAG